MIACPFCGWVETPKEKSEHIIVDGATTLQCRRCKATGPQTFDVNGGVEAWNKRAGGQQTAMSETGGTKGVGMSDLLEGVERALTKINEAEGYFLLGKIASGKNMLGDGKAILEKVVERWPTSSNVPMSESARTTQK